MENNPPPLPPQEQTLKEYIETNDKTIAQIVQFINLNLNQRISRLEGNLLEIKK